MKKSKIVVLVILIFVLSIIFPLTINAESYQINPENYHPNKLDKDEVEDMYAFGGSIAGVIQIVGTILSVASLMIIGIKYVMGSADEKAEFKGKMLPYIIGCVLLFGASNVVNVIYKMFN